MKICDRCGFESSGCPNGSNFVALTIDGGHFDLCGLCGDQYWRERKEFCISFEESWRKGIEIRRSMLRNEKEQTMYERS